MYILGNKVSLDFSPNSVADPGFPVGGRRPPMRILFSENERIGFCWGAHRFANEIELSREQSIYQTIVGMYVQMVTHWWIYIQKFPTHAPLWDLILLFSHTFSLKSSRIGGTCPPE